ncbi:MAG: glycosyltransferase, partial [Actinobacteria bacterium]|nr:glycosyltransferase [Actinomycetota bacterium]
MRVLFATPAYWPAVAFGGPIWVGRELTEGLAARGHQVDVVTTSLRAIGEPPAERLRTRTRMQAGVQVHELATPLRYRWMGVTPSLPLVLRSLPRPDVVHVFGYRDVVTTVAAGWARARSIPYVFEPLDMYVR